MFLHVFQTIDKFAEGERKREGDHQVNVIDSRRVFTRHVPVPTRRSVEPVRVLS